jgi:hypothetical protein
MTDSRSRDSSQILSRSAVRATTCASSSLPWRASVSRAATMSVMSVAVPNQAVTRPESSSAATLRPRNQRYVPSAARKRYSIS